VVSNLTGNAIDALNRSGILEISGRNLDLSAVPAPLRPAGADMNPLPAGPYVELRFRDQGPGIPESVRSRMFDPFYTTKEKGTGLGLSIVFSIIQNHSGGIAVESDPGEGATFRVYLPAAPDQKDETGGKDAPVPMIKMRVLLMDDDPFVLDTASGMLTSFGYEVTGCADGLEAVTRYRESFIAGQPYDLCILDLVIPKGMSGTECAREIRSIDPDAVLIVSSGYSDDPVMSRYRDYGFRGVIQKPYTMEELRQVLSDVLVL